MPILEGLMHDLMVGERLPEYKPSRWVEQKPPDMSDLEWAVYKELQRRKIPFRTQVNIAGGQGFTGGQRVDFWLTDRPTVIRVMGHWHDVPGAQEDDMLGRVLLEGQGYQVIDLYTQDIEVDLEGHLDAYLGISIPI